MKYVRRTLIALMVLLMALPAVAQAAASYTGYINRNTYVYKKASTSSKKVGVKVNTKVYVVGVSGRFYKIKNSKRTVTAYVLKGHVSRNKVSTGSGKTQETTAEESTEPTEQQTPVITPIQTPTGETTGTQTPAEETPTDTQTTEESVGGPSWKSKVVKLDWYKTGKNVLKRGGDGYLYDIKTGITLRIHRMGGTNHADVEPATAADTKKLKKIAGGKFSWTTHPVILKANGQYVACSINTLPHGQQTIYNNNYDGQFCLHMVNSRTHGSDKVNPNHQKCINQAYNWAH